VAEQLVARHGILTRDAIAAEEPAGGMSAVYPVLRALEESGRVRRGYFVTGLGGSQFAHPAALERLRGLRETAADALPGVVLASTDPANPFGAALPWPKAEAARQMRAAGTHVAIVDGRLAAYLGRGERELRTFLPAEEPLRSRVARALATALARWAGETGRAALGWAVADDVPLALGPLAPFLSEAGFVRFGPGFRLAAAPGPPLPGP
jgi:ATP-dependent Lhr-like helicase